MIFLLQDSFDRYKLSKLSRMEWTILSLIPSRIASPHFGWYSFPVPQRTGGWVGMLRVHDCERFLSADLNSCSRRLSSLTSCSMSFSPTSRRLPVSSCGGARLCCCWCCWWWRAAARNWWRPSLLTTLMAAESFSSLLSTRGDGVRGDVSADAATISANSGGRSMCSSDIV